MTDETITGKQVRSFVAAHRGLLAALAAGLVVAIGSSGLVLGGVTVAVSSLLVSKGVGLLGAMTIGFFGTGVVGVVTGLVLSRHAATALARKL